MTLGMARELAAYAIRRMKAEGFAIPDDAEPLVFAQLTEAILVKHAANKIEREVAGRLEGYIRGCFDRIDEYARGIEYAR